MYKLLKKQLKGKLGEYFEDKGFRNYNDNCFIAFNNDVLFKVSFDKSSCGSTLNMYFGIGFPLLRIDCLQEDLEKCIIESIDLSSRSWELERYKKYSFSQKEEQINVYIKEIEYIFENYIFYYMSKVINVFNLEEYIQHEYDELYGEYLLEKGEEDPSWVYFMEFLASGKTEDAWTEEEIQKSEMLTKEKQAKEFPYEKIKQQIVQRIEDNNSKLKLFKESLFNNHVQDIKVFPSILPTTLKEIFKNSNILEVINKYGFIRDDNINTSGRIDYGETYYFKKNKIELLVILSKELFLEFIVINEGKETRINIYDGSFFWFGWLVAKESTRDENINCALHQLKIKLNDLEK